MLTPAQWRDPANNVLDKYFEKGGALAQAMGKRFEVSDVQREFSIAVRRRILKGCDSPGRVVFLEGETGIGKTQAYLIPGLTHAVMTGQRMLVSTYTNFLKNQVAKGDGAAACAAVEAITGKKPVIALRLAYREFASPSRCHEYADRLQAQDGHNPAEVDALRSLGDWTEDEIDALNKEIKKRDGGTPSTFTSGQRGLVSTWVQENLLVAVALPTDAPGLWALAGDCDEDEKVLHQVYEEAALNAHCVVSTHAALLLDLKLWSKRMRVEDETFGLVVIDEADRLEDAAASVLGTKTAMRSLERVAILAESAVADAQKKSTVLDEATIKSLNDHISRNKRFFEDVTRLANKLSNDNKQHGRAAPTRIPFTGSETLNKEKLVNILDSATRAAQRLADLLMGTKSRLCHSYGRSLGEIAEDFSTFVEAAKDPLKKLGRTYISFSPLRAEPSIQIDAKRGSRITQRLWAPGKDGHQPIADAVILTSATLAQPNVRGPQRFEAIEKMVGADMWPDRFDAEACQSFAPAKFGELKFVLPLPNAPLPGTVADEDADEDSPDHISYCARMIAAAARMPTRDRRANVLVLTTSFADTHLLAEALNAMDDLAGRVVERTRGMSLAKAAELFRTQPDIILLTPGAHQGPDLPGLIDHLVITRIPFSPPEDAWGFPYVKTAEDGITQVASPDIARAMRRLRQGIGRAIRQANDKAIVWICDPRFGIPARLDEEHDITNIYVRGALYQSCVPPRFRDALSHAQIFEIERKYEAAAPTRRPKKNRR